MKQEEQQKIIEKLAKNPKVIKALENLLKPLQQEGDKLIIRGIK